MTVPARCLALTSWLIARAPVGHGKSSIYETARIRYPF